MTLGVMILSRAMSKLQDPDWPKEPENIIKALEIAFKDNIIEDHNHPILKKLRGEL